MTNTKKTVGILSMQRVPNYGSFLQAYGLKRLLLECGAGEVHFIDIEQGHVLPGYAVRRSPLQKIRHIVGALLDGSLLFRLRSRRFYAEMLSRITSNFPLLGLDELRPEHYDLAVIGSDEVFNCCQACAWGYTPQLFGRIPQADRVISYAASFGHTTYEEICAAVKKASEGELKGIVEYTDDVKLITDTGTIIRINVSEISILGRSTQGVTLMRTNEGKVVSIEKITEQEEE